MKHRPDSASSSSSRAKPLSFRIGSARVLESRVRRPQNSRPASAPIPGKTQKQSSFKKSAGQDTSIGELLVIGKAIRHPIQSLAGNPLKFFSQHVSTSVISYRDSDSSLLDPSINDRYLFNSEDFNREKAQSINNNFRKRSKPVMNHTSRSNISRKNKHYWNDDLLVDENNTRDDYFSKYSLNSHDLMHVDSETDPSASTSDDYDELLKPTICLKSNSCKIATPRQKSWRRDICSKEVGILSNEEVTFTSADEESEGTVISLGQMIKTLAAQQESSNSDIEKVPNLDDCQVSEQFSPWDLEWKHLIQNNHSLLLKISDSELGCSTDSVNSNDSHCDTNGKFSDEEESISSDRSLYSQDNKKNHEVVSEKSKLDRLVLKGTTEAKSINNENNIKSVHFPVNFTQEHNKSQYESSKKPEMSKKKPEVNKKTTAELECIEEADESLKSISEMETATKITSDSSLVESSERKLITNGEEKLIKPTADLVGSSGSCLAPVMMQELHCFTSMCHTEGNTISDSGHENEIQVKIGNNEIKTDTFENGGKLEKTKDDLHDDNSVSIRNISHDQNNDKNQEKATIPKSISEQGTRENPQMTNYPLIKFRSNKRLYSGPSQDIVDALKLLEKESQTAADLPDHAASNLDSKGWMTKNQINTQNSDMCLLMEKITIFVAELHSNWKKGDGKPDDQSWLNKCLSCDKLLEEICFEEKIKPNPMNDSKLHSNCEKNLSQKQKDFESRIQKNLDLIRKLLDDKKALTEKCESLTTENTLLERRHSNKLKLLQERNSQEMQSLKEKLALAEQNKREKWTQQKARLIKESTYRGIEGKMKDLSSKHREEMCKLKDIHWEELRKLEENNFKKIREMEDEVKAKYEREKELILGKEKERDRERLNHERRQAELVWEARLESSHKQFLRTKMEIEEENSRKLNRVAANHEDVVASLKKEIENLKEYSDESIRATKRKFETDLSNLRLSSDQDCKEWKGKFAQEQEEVRQKLEKDVREKSRKQRDKEIDKAIKEIHKEVEIQLQDQQRTFDNKIKNFRERYESEITELESGERASRLKYLESKGVLAQREEELVYLKARLHTQTMELTDLQHMFGSNS